MLRDIPLYVFRDSRMSKRLFLFPPLKRLVVYHKVCHFSCLLSDLMHIDTTICHRKHNFLQGFLIRILNTLAYLV